MSKLGSILLGVVAGTAAGIGVVLLLDKEKTLEEKVDHLFSDSDSKPEDLIKLLEKKLASLKEKAKK